MNQMDEANVEFLYENALRTLETQLYLEKNFPTLVDQLKIQPNILSVSGLKDGDYPVVNEFIGGSIKIAKTSLIPIQLCQRTREMKQNCIMKVFPEIERLCITVDSQLFMWNYETKGDPEFYNEIPDTILCLNLLKPKAAVFHHNIHYLMFVSTSIETIVLGVTVNGYKNSAIEFTREPLFCIATDNEEVTSIESINGRVFIGTQMGSVLEVVYWTEKPSWFSITKQSYYVNSKCAYEYDWKVYMKVINHSAWMLSVLIPNVFLNGFSQKESIIQIATDPTRNSFYTLSDSSTISQYQLFANNSLKRVNYVYESNIISKISKAISYVDHSQFRNIVHLAPLPIGYGCLKLMAVTQNGIRLYFSDDLRLCHVRMPPINSSSMNGKISNVRYCCESRGSILMMSGTVSSQALFTINPDTFISHDLMETVSVTWTQQNCWVLLPLDKNEIWKQAGPPIIQTQHIDALRRFLMVSSESVLHLELPSPIHNLRNILEKPTVSPQSTEIKNWISHFGIDETEYATLVLAMESKKSNSSLSNRAVDIVLYLLEENVRIRKHNVEVCGTKYDIANPLHHLLCLYAARILRPLWDSFITEQVNDVVSGGGSSSGSNQTAAIGVGNVDNDDQIYESSHDFEQLGWYLVHLVYLHDFIRDNYHRIKAIDEIQFSSDHPNCRSLALEMLELLKVAIEVTGLWRLITEHQFSRVMRHLSYEIRTEFLNSPVKHLLLPSKRYLLLTLISALLEYYLEDGSSTENIIEALLKVCPNIYRLEDALCSKANELLITIDTLSMDPTVDREVYLQKKNATLREAIDYYEKVGPHIDLGSVVCRLKTVGCLWGAVHLCLHTAKLRDPDEIAFVCLREARRPHTNIEVAAVEGRNDAYKYMLECLTNLMDVCKQDQPSLLLYDPARGDVSVGTTMNNPFGVSSNSQIVTAGYKIDAMNDLNVILDDIFNNKNDIMAHYEVYSWMLDNDMSNDIIKYSNSHLESYLQQCLQQDPDSVDIKMLLWKYFEIQGKYSEAAKVLDNLAVSENRNLSLDDRIECLSRAIVFLKAVIGDKQFMDSDFLKELEDKVEIANLQKVIIDEVGRENVEVCNELNSRIFNVFTLLKDYVDPLELSVSKLYILKVSGQQDNMRQVWEDVIEREVMRAESCMSLDSKMTVLRQGVVHIIRTFSDNLSFIPLDLILYHLDSYADSSNFPIDWTMNCMLSGNIPMSKILLAYHDVVRMKNNDVKKFIHRIFESICCGLNMFIESEMNINPVVCSQIDDLITTCLIQLQSKPNTSVCDIVDKLKAFQSLIQPSM